MLYARFWCTTFDRHTCDHPSFGGMKRVGFASTTRACRSPSTMMPIRHAMSVPRPHICDEGVQITGFEYMVDEKKEAGASAEGPAPEEEEEHAAAHGVD
mmetsp:Transcript_73692/g.173085  ORF Transcript_73692/g.173085 Transcript_73692/m.173085 type:complete len:99 (-) Transcript_73692:449-745(-)